MNQISRQQEGDEARGRRTPETHTNVETTPMASAEIKAGQAIEIPPQDKENVGLLPITWLLRAGKRAAAPCCALITPFAQNEHSAAL